MKFKVLSKVRVVATGETGFIAFTYQAGEKVVVAIDNGRDRLFDEGELEYHLGESIVPASSQVIQRNTR